MLLKLIALLKTRLFSNNYLQYRVLSPQEISKRTKKVSLQKKVGVTIPPSFDIKDKYKLAMLAMRREREMRDEFLLRKSIRGIRHRFKVFSAMLITRPTSQYNFNRTFTRFIKEYGKTKRTLRLTIKERRWLFAQYNIYRKLSLFKKFTGIPLPISFILNSISSIFSVIQKFIRFIGRLFKINPYRIQWFLSNPLLKERKGTTEIGIYTIMEETIPDVVDRAFEAEITHNSRANVFNIPQQEQFSRKYEEPDFGILDELMNDYEDEITAGRIYRTKISLKRAFRQDYREYRRFKPWNINWGYLSRNRVIARYMRFSFPKRLRKSLKKIPKYYWYKHEASFNYIAHGYVKLSFVNNIRHFINHRVISKFTTVYAHVMNLDPTRAYFNFDSVKTYLTYPLYPFMSLQKGLYRFYYTKVRRVFEDFYISSVLFLKKYTKLPYSFNPLLDRTIMREKTSKLRSLERELYYFSKYSAFKLYIIRKLRIAIKLPPFQFIIAIFVIVKTIFERK